MLAHKTSNIFNINKNMNMNKHIGPLINENINNCCGTLVPGIVCVFRSVFSFESQKWCSYFVVSQVQ